MKTKEEYFIDYIENYSTINMNDNAECYLKRLKELFDVGYEAAKQEEREKAIKAFQKHCSWYISGDCSEYKTSCGMCEHVNQFLKLYDNDK